MNRIFSIAALMLSVMTISSAGLCADRALIALNTSGTVYQLDPKTGALTQKADESLTTFSLGGFARSKNTVYYVAAPGGTTENAVYTFAVKTGTLTHVMFALPER